MTYEEFLKANRNRLIGYLMLTEFSANPDALSTPFPPSKLSEKALNELKCQLKRHMPLDSMIIDLWDWDIHFEDDLGDDWYFEAVFGAQASIEQCAKQLADFFFEKCNEYSIDYNQSPNDPDFEKLIQNQAENFILDWRNSAFVQYALPSASVDMSRVTYS
jgi:hypothetical protein